ERKCDQTYAPRKGGEESSTPLRGAVPTFGPTPGVRKKRVHLANIPTRLWRAEISKRLANIQARLRRAEISRRLANIRARLRRAENSKFYPLSPLCGWFAPFLSSVGSDCSLRRFQRTNPSRRRRRSRARTEI